jgi:hypothetical protein
MRRRRKSRLPRSPFRVLKRKWVSRYSDDEKDKTDQKQKSRRLLDIFEDLTYCRNPAITRHEQASYHSLTAQTQ